jgi:hypothetical protein
MRALMAVVLAIATVPDWFVCAMVVALAVAFAIGRLTKKTWHSSDAKKLFEDANQLTEETQRMLAVVAEGTAYKAAVYSVVGVILGAAGGLFAELVTRGSMSTWGAVRAFGAVVVLGCAAYFIAKKIERHWPSPEAPHSSGVATTEHSSGRDHGTDIQG